MATLARDLRTKVLEPTVKNARGVAEAGALKTLNRLGVGEAQAPKLTQHEQNLRRRLRAHGRQLGDQRDERRGTQAVDRLKSECAYEHWHRMLFARFLADNDLLIEPETGMPISLGDCQLLARERQEDWLELASTFAERMLPQIFRKGDPVLEITLPPETRSELEDLLKALPREVFLADDSLGWVYQFWQAEKKTEVNKFKKEIGADELPAVTQQFTEDYMVLFLLHNTLGAWWAGKILAAQPALRGSAKTEDELRDACAVGGVNWTYLRFDRGDDGFWKPAAGTFDDWPRLAKEITLLDPCMGSGHFLAFALPILAALRMEDESISRENAVEAVIRDNLFGLEIDSRCTQIAAFNIAFAAWRSIGYRTLPKLNVACSGLTINVPEEAWLKLAGVNQRLRNGMEHIYRLFRRAPILGSLIDPHVLGGDLLVAEFRDLQPLVESALSDGADDLTQELAVAAWGLSKAAAILADRFTLIATNVPYLSRNKQAPALQTFCTDNYPRSNTDLATVFIERSLKWLKPGGTAALVVPRIWMTYTAYYEKLRCRLLEFSQFDFIAFIGKNGFETIKGEIVDVALIGLTHRVAPKHDTTLFDVSADLTPDTKARALSDRVPHRSPQSNFLNRPACTIAVEPDNAFNKLADYVDCYEGLSRGDAGRFDRYFWELPVVSLGRWVPLIHSSSCKGAISGNQLIFLWEEGRGALARSEGARVQGDPAWGRSAVFVSRTHLNACLTFGLIHAQNGVAIVPRDEQHLLPILAYCSSAEYRNAVLSLNQKLIKPTGVMDKVPFDLQLWSSLASKGFPQGIPLTRSSDPTQWYFAGDPRESDHPLQVAVMRLLGYQWPRQTGSQLAGIEAFDRDGLETHADRDGIVCLSPIKGERASERLIALLREAYGPEWSATKLASLLTQAGFEGHTLDVWLRDGFFDSHCSLFHQRPIVWHIWDGRRDGFHALVNYHQLAAPNGGGQRLLKKLTYAYLGEWIAQQRADQKAGGEGADARVAAAERLRIELERIIAGETPYDLFVRWKSLSQQAIGWDPDVEDGIRLNIRPFLTANLGSTTKGASVFRVRPRVSWTKDDGKESTGAREAFPWLFGWDGVTHDWPGGASFSGERHNDCHYSTTTKVSAAQDGHGMASQRMPSDNEA